MELAFAGRGLQPRPLDFYSILGQEKYYEAGCKPAPAKREKQ